MSISAARLTLSIPQRRERGKTRERSLAKNQGGEGQGASPTGSWTGQSYEEWVWQQRLDGSRERGGQQLWLAMARRRAEAAGWQWLAPASCMLKCDGTQDVSPMSSHPNICNRQISEYLSPPKKGRKIKGVSSHHYTQAELV